MQKIRTLARGRGRLQWPAWTLVFLLAGLGCSDGSDDDGGALDPDAGADARDDGSGEQDSASDPGTPDTLADGNLEDTNGNVGNLDECEGEVEGERFFVETLTLANEAEGVSVKIVRFPGDGPTIGETFALELASFGIIDAGEATCILDRNQMLYEYGHHNWSERAQISIDGGKYILTMAYDWGEETWDDAIERQDADGGMVWGPISLTAISCQATGDGKLNACFRRPGDE